MNQRIFLTYRAALFIVVGVLCIGLAPAKASTVTALIDFANYAPGGLSPTTGTVWNNVAPATTVNSLVDTGNNAFGTLTFGTGGTNVWLSTGNPGFSGAIGNFPSTATGDFMFIDQTYTSATFTLTGLDTTGTISYSFKWLSSRATQDGTGRPLTLTFTGANSGFATENATNAGDALGNSTFQTVSGIFADNTGTITVVGTNSPTHFAYLNAIQIDATAGVPEPTTIALSILGGLGLFVVVVRRRQLAKA